MIQIQEKVLAVLAGAQLLLMVGLSFYISVLEVRLAQKEVTITKLESEAILDEVRIKELSSGNDTLKVEIGKLNTSLENISQASKDKVAKSVQALEVLKKYNQKYEDQIQELKARKPVGKDQCEKVLSVLQDL